MRSEADGDVDVKDETHDLREQASAALGALREAIEANRQDEDQLVEQVTALQQLLNQGTSVTIAFSSEPLADTLPLLSRVLARSMCASGTARRTLVRAMRAEGASIPAIAQLFGVSRQRVSNVLRRPPAMPRLVVREALAARLDTGHLETTVGDRPGDNPHDDDNEGDEEGRADRLSRGH